MRKHTEHAIERQKAPQPTAPQPQVSDAHEWVTDGKQAQSTVQPSMRAQPSPNDPFLLRRLAPPQQRQTLHALQRTQGNAHVQRLMVGSAAIQRQPLPTATDFANDTALGSVTLGPDDVALYKLYGWKNDFFNPHTINRDATCLLQAFPILDQIEQKAELALNVLETHQGHGTAALTSVEGAAGAIGTGSVGQGGEYSRKAIEDYLESIEGANRDLRELGEKRNAVDIAVSKIRTLSLEQDKMKQEDLVKELEKRTAEEQKQIDDQKKYISQLIGMTTFFVNPTQWVSVTVNAGIFIGQEIVEKNLSSSHLESLQKELGEAKAKLRDIQSQEIVSRMHTASLELDQARLDLANAKKDFLGRFDKIRLKETTVVEAFGQATETSGAAGAIAERGTVGIAAVNAEQLLNSYRDHATIFLQRLQTTDWGYAQVQQILVTNPSLAARDETHAAHLDTVSSTNRGTLELFKQWVADAQANAEDRLAYLAKGEYLAGYDEIPRALQGALEDRTAPKP